MFPKLKEKFFDKCQKIAEFTKASIQVINEHRGKILAAILAAIFVPDKNATSGEACNAFQYPDHSSYHLALDSLPNPSNTFISKNITVTKNSSDACLSNQSLNLRKRNKSPEKIDLPKKTIQGKVLDINGDPITDNIELKVLNVDDNGIPTFLDAHGYADVSFSPQSGDFTITYNPADEDQITHLAVKPNINYYSKMSPFDPNNTEDHILTLEERPSIIPYPEIIPYVPSEETPQTQGTYIIKIIFPPESKDVPALAGLYKIARSGLWSGCYDVDDYPNKDGIIFNSTIKVIEASEKEVSFFVNFYRKDCAVDVPADYEAGIAFCVYLGYTPHPCNGYYSLKNSLILPGDTNNDRQIDLPDAILAAQMLTANEFFRSLDITGYHHWSREGSPVAAGDMISALRHISDASLYRNIDTKNHRQNQQEQNQDIIYHDDLPYKPISKKVQ